MVFFFCIQSNKREKDSRPLESQNNKELEQPVASERLEEPKLSSSQSPSPPVHGQPRRGGGKAERGVKRGLKNKAAATAADSVSGKGAADSAVKPTQRAEQQQQEHGAKRSSVRSAKTTSPARRESAAASENTSPPHAYLPAGQSSLAPCREEDNRSERRRDEQELKHDAVATDAASHSNKTQVSLQMVSL